MNKVKEKAPTENVGANIIDNSEKEKVLKESNDDVKIVKTDDGEKNGQDKCPKCGSTEISFNSKTGKLTCNFCRHEFEPENVRGLESDVSKIKGQIMTSGSGNIAADSKDVVTLKCSSCGAEVVIDTAFAMQARCHWCRNTLSINAQIPNGATADVVLPFSVSKEDAKKAIETFVGKRKFFAHPKFRAEFTTNNIMGVYFPYMLVDVNSHASLSGQGEKEVRSYTVKEGDHYRTYYDADLYNVSRDFDLMISDLSIESSLDKLDKKNKNKTTNIINSIMPFDTENCVKYNANYLKGYTSEKRDTNVDDLKPIVDEQSKDVARFAANDTLGQYNRGVAWSSEELDIKGQQWKAAYLPVWLYSYQEVSGKKKLLHYVAVNARTLETMGSVPIHMPVLIGVSLFIEILGVIAFLLVDSDYSFIFLFAGIVYYLIMYARYRNSGARHNYEINTKREVRNMKEEDNYVKRRTGLSNSTMSGANNKRVSGESKVSSVINSLASQNEITSFVKDKVDKTIKK